MILVYIIIIEEKYIVKTVISPAVIYYDNQNLKDIFVRQFKEAIYDT